MTMTNETKMTYVKALDYVLEHEDLPEDVREKLAVLKEQTAKRNSSKSAKPTAKQTEMAELAERMYNLMLASGEALTVSEWMTKDAEFKGRSNQQVTAIMRALIAQGKVEKIPDKRKSLFKAI